MMNSGGTTSTGGTTMSTGGTTNTGGTTSTGGTTGSSPPSCAGLPATCGASSNESCCTSPLVTGGTFYRDYDGVTFTDQNYPATVSDFRLDKFEVTVGRFRKFKAAWDGGWRPTAGAGKHTHLNGGSGLSNSGAAGYEPGWDTAWASSVAPTDANLSCYASYQTWTSSAGANENRPMNCPNWWEQYAFCIWDGGFLPTEAEWNYAAAGGSEQRVYPWSNPPSSTSIDDTRAVYCGGSCSTTQNVGVKPAGNGKYGQADLAGNVWEWNLDWYVSPYVATGNNCAYLPASSSTRVIRGGDFYAGASDLLASSRYDYPLTSRDSNFGARCARTP
jgi:sulfatase modifying factor 1